MRHEERIFTSVADRARIFSFAEMLFDKFVALPKDVRPDDKKRTGIQMVIRQIGTRNVTLDSIYSPSELAQFLADEKAVRSATLGHATSQNSENPEKLQFMGSVTFSDFQVSISGLIGHEDVFGSVAVMALLFGVTMDDVIKDIEARGGLLPEWASNKNSYHWSIL